MGKIFLLMGKSAAGKDALYRELLKNEEFQFRSVVLYTTRPMRKGECEGLQYHFTDEAGYREYRRQNRIIESRSYQTQLGEWHYFTADDGQIDLTAGSYLMIGTIESYLSIRAYFGTAHVLPILIETDDGIRLERALKRERRQEHPRYDEMCRRFLADEADFSDEKKRRAGIMRVFRNDTTKEACLAEISEYIRTQLHITF